MSAGRVLAALAGGAARRGRAVLITAVVLALAAAALALRLQPTAATSTFVSSSSRTYADTQRFYEAFGEEPVEVLVKGDLQQLLLSSDLGRLVGLEGCLSGNVPRAALPAEGGMRGPCAGLTAAHAVKVVLGPGTFVNEAANQIDEQLASQAAQAQSEASQAEAAVRRAALARGVPSQQARALGRAAARVTSGRFQESVALIALQYGLSARPSLNDANFVSALVFDSSKPAGTPKQRFAYLFPSRDAALVSVRMRAGLSEQQRKHTIALIRAAVAMPQWRLQHGSYLVSGEPVIVADLTRSITSSLTLLLVAVLIVMAGVLSLIFSGRPRLLPLAVAALATALTFAGLWLVRGSVALAEVAVLPVLVGLAVDYAIQFQARVHEQEAGVGAVGDAGAARAGGAAGGAGQIAAAARAGGPAIAVAATASAAAMLILLLSPVPMVRGFGVLLVVGLAVAFLCAFSAGAAALSLRAAASGASPAHMRSGAARMRAWLEARVGPSWRGARELLFDNPLARALGRAALEGAVRRPALVLVVGLVLAGAGWGLDTQTHVQTDITRLVPQTMGSLRNLGALQRASGVGGEIDLMVTGKDVAKPATIEWMSNYQASQLRRFGYGSQSGCGHARLCPAFSLPDLFGGQAGAVAGAAAGAAGRARRLSANEVQTLLRAIPPYFSQDVITPDRGAATLAFGIRLMGLQQQEQLIEQMRSALHPPRGVDAALVGLPVLAAASGSQVASVWRRMETLLAGLAAVALVLLAAFRGDLRRALVPLVPIALATGWSALVLFALRVPLNPMSVMLGALVVAISTEFSVLLSERVRQERLAGHSEAEALRRGYRRTGAAVLASGATAIAGFGVLILSDITMLRDFGVVTVIDLTVALVGVLVALPAALTLAGSPARSAPSARWRPRSARGGDFARAVR